MSSEKILKTKYLYVEKSVANAEILKNLPRAFQKALVSSHFPARVSSLIL